MPRVNLGLEPPRRKRSALSLLARPLPTLRQRRVYGEAPVPLRKRGVPPWQPWPYIEERLRHLAEAAGLEGTLPERLVRLYLLIREIPFRYETIMGTPLRLGGAIVDYLLPTVGARGTVVRVQGDYWHTLFPRMQRDRLQYEILSRRYRVIDVWESDLRRAAAYGIEGLLAYMDDLLFGV